MIRYYCLRSLALALAGLAILSVAEPLRADVTSTRQFWGSLTVQLPAVLNENNYGSNKDLTYQISGKVSPLGYVGGTIIININTERTSHTCRMTLVDKKGNEVYLHYTVSRPSTASQYQDSTFTIDGGTGKYAGAMGDGNVRHLQFAHASIGGTNHIQISFYDAWISYPAEN